MEVKGQNMAERLMIKNLFFFILGVFHLHQITKDHSCTQLPRVLHETNISEAREHRGARGYPAKPRTV